MLHENNTTRAHHTRYYDDQAYPPYRIKGKKERKGHQSAQHPSYCRGVCRHLPPYINNGTHHLYGQCRQEHARHKTGNVHHYHHIIATEIEKNGTDIRNHTTLPRTKLNENPSLILAIEMDKECWEKNGKYIYHAEHYQFILPGEQTHIAEGEQRKESDDGQIEWGEHKAQHPCRKYKILHFHFFLILAMGMSS